MSAVGQGRGGKPKGEASKARSKRASGASSGHGGSEGGAEGAGGATTGGKRRRSVEAQDASQRTLHQFLFFRGGDVRQQADDGQPPRR